MPAIKNSLSEKYFDEVYSANTDPWNFEGSDYERAKYAVTINALTKPLYHNVFEIGCSIGVLSEMIMNKCENLLAVDAVEAPLVKARQRLSAYPNVQVKRMTVPADFGNEMYDLIIISEVAYYLDNAALGMLRKKTMKQLIKGGQLLMVHWTPLVHDYPQTGNYVNDYFLELDKIELKHLQQQRHETYRLDLFEKIN